MTKQELVTYVNAEITASCSIPFSPPPAEIERLINLEQNWISIHLSSVFCQRNYI